MCSKQHTEMVMLLDDGMSSIKHPVRPNVLETWPGNAVQHPHENCGQSRDVLYGRGRLSGATDPFEEPM